jgi:glycine cleavage system H protein
MAGTEVREGYRYTMDHVCLSASGAERLVGVTAYAVDQLGDVTLVTIDVKPGDMVTAGKAFGTVESVKTLSDLYAPISGKVVRVNTELESKPELVNEDPYGKAWLVAIEGEGGDDLMDAAAYAKFLEAAAHLARPLRQRAPLLRCDRGRGAFSFKRPSSAVGGGGGLHALACGNISARGEAGDRSVNIFARAGLHPSPQFVPKRV